MTLSGPVAAEAEFELEYLVPGARWVPNYALRLEKGMTGGTLQLRASVAQATGEDWTGVALSLSTASLSRRADLPELRSLRIGRRQEPPPRSGWREPPPGLDALFEAYDQAMAGVPRPALLGKPMPVASPKGVALREESRRDDRSAEKAKKRAAPSRGGAGAPMSSGAFGGMPPPAPPPPAPMAMPAMANMAPQAPMAKMASVRPALARSRRAVAADEDEATGVDMMMAEEAEAPMADLEGGAFDLPAEPEPAAAMGLDVALLDYSRLVMLGVSGAQRGRLQPGSPWDFAFVAGVSVQVDVVMAAVARAQSGAAQVRSLPLPSNCRDVGPMSHFDYRYDCAAPADVPSTGKWTTVPVMTCNVGLTPE